MTPTRYLDVKGDDWSQLIEWMHLPELGITGTMLMQDKNSDQLANLMIS